MAAPRVSVLLVTSDHEDLVGRALASIESQVQDEPIEVVVGTDVASGSVVIEVRDHGPGIDPDQALDVFERFYRADKARSRASGGSGLGLAIVAAIVNSHHGRVGVTRTEGGGATFIVELPTVSSQEQPNSL